MLKIAFLMDPARQIRTLEDTTALLMEEASRRGHRVFHLEPEDLALDSRKGLLLRLTPVTVDARRGIRALGGARRLPLSQLDALWIRKDPPFDLKYYHFLLLLTLFEDRILMINRPSSLILGNEKLLAFRFPRQIPRTRAAFRREELADFLKTVPRALWKPLEERAGCGIVRLNAKLRARRTEKWGVAQEYLPAIRKTGDKRVILLDGKVLAVFTRFAPRKGWLIRPAVEDGPLKGARLSARERAFLKQAGPELRRLGFYFAGLDLIGGRLTEINVTSPGGLPEANLFRTGRALEQRVLDFVERKLRAPSKRHPV